MKFYNFWGIAKEGDKKHPFYGITHFKKGFGGFEKDLLPAHDLKVSFKYWIDYVIETLRRIKRGF
jgi:lipid II:glycine glycyltransferase (peptidoglycan interpeptide bridge formation enzyme)